MNDSRDSVRQKYRMEREEKGGKERCDSIIPALCDCLPSTRLNDSTPFLPLLLLLPRTINSSTAALSTRSNSMSKLEAQSECGRRVNMRTYIDG